jgi:hypothetical protein
MAEMPRQLTQAEIDRILFNQRMGMQPTPPSIENLQRGTSGTVTPIPQNLFQRMAGGAGAAGQFVNQAGTAADIAKLFPGYTGQSQVNIPTGFNFAPKQDPMGGVIPGGLQTQQLNVDQLLKAIKPADVLGLTGAQQAYTDVGMGKAPNPMDVLDIAALGYLPAKAAMTSARIGKGLLSATKTGIDSIEIPPLFGKGVKDGQNYKISEEGGFYNVTPRELAEGGDAFKQAQGIGVFPGTASATRGRGQSVYGFDEQEANRQVFARLSNPEQNPLLNIANSYTQGTLGKPYDLNLKMPESSLAKQSGIGRSYEIMADASKQQKDAVFNAYVNDPEFAPIIQQFKIKDYDDLVAKSYQQLEKETVQQFRKLPLRLQFHTGSGNYLNSAEAIRDMILHGNLTVYKGGDRHEFLHNIDKDTGLNSNEMFRAVHDVLGHGIRGNSFGALGEEIAFGSHSQMYSPLARIAMTSETRGQNSFVNYTPINAALTRTMEKLRQNQYEAKRRGDDGLAAEIAQSLRDLGNDWQYAKQASVALPPEFTRTDFAGGMPEYLRRTQNVPLEIAPEQLTHFGKKSGLLELDPSKYSTGLRGAELSRLDQTKNPVRDRSYFYRGTPESVKPEAGLGPNVYTAMLPNLYDITADPLRLGQLANVRNMTSWASKYGQGRFDAPQSLTDLERLTKEYGYSGLLDPTKAVIWNPTRVRQVK